MDNMIESKTGFRINPVDLIRSFADPLFSVCKHDDQGKYVISDPHNNHVIIEIKEWTFSEIAAKALLACSKLRVKAVVSKYNRTNHGSPIP